MVNLRIQRRQLLFLLQATDKHVNERGMLTTNDSTDVIDEYTAAFKQAELLQEALKLLDRRIRIKELTNG